MSKIYKIYHLIFLLILSIHYSLSFFLFDGIIFGQETDVFEAELLFNKILGDFYRNDYYILNGLLNGSYEWYYFSRALYIINYIYAFFSTENAFLIIDILCKIIAYISFFKLSRLLKNSFLFSFLISAIYSYASTSSFTDYHSSIFGFGSVILPYLTYLILKRKDFKMRNYLIIIITALNSHFYFGIFYLLIPLILQFYNNNLNKIKSFKLFIVFFIFCILANSNLLYVALFDETIFNRDSWKLEPLDLHQNISYFFSSLFNFPISFVQVEFPDGEMGKIIYFTTFFNKICLFLIYTFTIFLLFLNKIENSKLFLITIISLLGISFISKTHVFSSLVNYIDIGIIKTIQLTRVKVILTFIFLFAIANIKIKNNKKYISFILFSIYFFFQINHMVLPAFKKYIGYNNISNLEKKEFKYYLINFELSKLKNLIKKNSYNKEYNDYLTINNYYDFKNFSYIKKLVKNDYVLPININPAKLIYNKINTAGGYFQFYPEIYKQNFKKIIEKELENDNFWKKDFNSNGHRLYAFIYNNKNIQLNFNQIKKMHISYLLSDKRLFNENIQIICEDCNGKSEFNLYSIY